MVYDRVYLVIVAFVGSGSIADGVLCDDGDLLMLSFLLQLSSEWAGDCQGPFALGCPKDKANIYEASFSWILIGYGRFASHGGLHRPSIISSRHFPCLVDCGRMCMLYHHMDGIIDGPLDPFSRG
mmetsp:Transcript_12708/g.18547  ORF Transcript_12708/g.18547 Transcript_12708/m.18547 type:complete len:125 (+) Transcript_12708:804-1178(+)